jgi:hypothetical protein
MKNTASLIFIIFFALLLYPKAEAQKQVPKDKALNVLLRTNRVLGHAHMSVKRGKVYTGDLAKAVRHQRYAKKLYNNGNYLKAIHHSRRARLLAIEAIKANKVKPTGDCSITPEENELMGTVPSDKDLEEELAKDGIPELKDEDLVNNNNLDIEVK